MKRIAGQMAGTGDGRLRTWGCGWHLEGVFEEYHERANLFASAGESSLFINKTSEDRLGKPSTMKESNNKSKLEKSENPPAHITLYMCEVKQRRAQGGCLGTKSR